MKLWRAGEGEGPVACGEGCSTPRLQAVFVSPVEDEPAPARHRPAHLLRRTFDLPQGATRARAYATAHGIYELFVNGERVGDHELTPGFTAYRTHLEVQTYDVTAHLRTGTNTLCAVLSDGWYRGLVGFTREHDTYGEHTALLVQLEVDTPDGRLVVGTDEDWESATVPSSPPIKRARASITHQGQNGGRSRRHRRPRSWTCASAPWSHAN